MQKQYNELKEKHPDAILFFRLGDFYEMFGEDAIEASRILHITLTARHKETPNPVPMCGVPYHAAENYLAKLTKAGKKVAIAEQVSDPRLPGIVKRDVIRIVTPGTTFSEHVLEAKESQFLVALWEQSGIFAIAVADLSTGEFHVLERDSFEDAKREILRIAPKELVFPPNLFSREEFQSFSSVISTQIPKEEAYRHLIDHFQTKNLKGFGIEEKPICIQVASLLLTFLEETQKGKVPHIQNIRWLSPEDSIPLDPETIRNLELFYDSEGKKDGSLVGILDETKTAMGGRKLRMSVLQPLKDEKRIQNRLDAVEELYENPGELKELEGHLKEISDLERLIGKISCGRGNPRDLLALKQSLKKIPELKEILRRLKHVKGSLIEKLLED